MIVAAVQIILVKFAAAGFFDGIVLGLDSLISLRKSFVEFVAASKLDFILVG